MSAIERVIPVLVYEDMAAGHDFLVEAFGFTSGGIHRNADGKPVHAEVRAGDFVIWLHRVAPELDLASPRSMPAASSGLVVHVEDVDAHCKRVCPRSTSRKRTPGHAVRPAGGRCQGCRRASVVVCVPLEVRAVPLLTHRQKTQARSVTVIGRSDSELRYGAS